MEICGTGRVLEVEGERAIVEISRQSACGHCGSAGLCGAFGAGHSMRLSVANPIGAQKGQLVEISASNLPGLRATFLVYLLPAVLFLAGVLIGAEVLHWESWQAGLLGVAMLGVSWFIARRVDESARRSGRFQLSIGRIVAG